jgi:hypothetical protein
MSITAAASDIVLVFIAANNSVATACVPFTPKANRPQAGGYGSCFFGEK